MLIQFRVENHRSLFHEVVFSMVATTSNQQGVISIAGLGETLLRVAGIYGGNASGKSNLFDGLSFMRRAVLSSYALWPADGGVPRKPFALTPAGFQNPSLYEVDLVVDGARYRYGFVVDDHGVVEEWLWGWPSGSEILLFEREHQHFGFNTLLEGENKLIEQLTRPNCLFLSSAAQNNHRLLGRIYQWFHRFLLIAPARNPVADTPSLIGYDPQMVLKLLEAADTGIMDFKVEGTHLYFRHSGGDNWLSWEDESAGTRALIHHMPMLFRVLEQGGVLCVDELDGHLHPLIAGQLVQMFQTPNPHTPQLLFNTHDTSLLGGLASPSPLHRDHIWLMEKNGEGISSLYPLSDFLPIESEDIEKGYLEGRYGGIPFVRHWPQLFRRGA